MAYVRENLENSIVKFTIDSEQDQWQNALTQAYNTTKGKFALKGFRKGQAPRKAIEREYGPTVFFEEAIDLILPELYNECLNKETDIEPLAQPEVDIKAVTDTTLKVEFLVTVKPNFVLGQYKNLKIEKASAEVSEEEIEIEIKKEIEKRATTDEITDRAIINGDIANIDFSGSVDGVKFDGGTAEKFDLVIGSNSFIPGFEEQIIGMNIGEEKDITVKFPEDYQAEELSGKDSVFAVKLNTIKAKTYPVLTNELVEEISEVNTVEEYKESIKAKIAEEKLSNIENEFESKIMETIAYNTEFVVPKKAIDSKIEEMLEQFKHRIEQQGMKMEDYIKYTGQNEQTIRQMYAESAEKNIKMRLIMEQIITNEKIEPSTEELDSKVELFAKQQNVSVEEFKQNMNQQTVTYIINQAVTDKLFAFLKKENIAE